MTERFEVSKIPDMKDKIVLITGSNTGIGYEAALALAGKGAHVYMACRSESKAHEAISKIKTEHPEAKLSFLKLDLQDLKQVKQAASEFSSREERLDVLINNAVNHLGHFLFTNELLPVLLKSAEPRVVIVSSGAYAMVAKQGVSYPSLRQKPSDNAEDTSVKLNVGQLYAQSKLCNILHCVSLAKKYDKLYVNALHPGTVNTDIFRNSKEMFGKWFYVLYPVFWTATRFFMSARDGALATLFLASSPWVVEQKKSGGYFGPYGKEDKVERVEKVEEQAEYLWVFSETLVNEELSK